MCLNAYIRRVSPGSRLEIIIDIFLPNWRRQVRFVRILDAITNRTESSWARHPRRGWWSDTWWRTRWRGRDGRRRLSNCRRSKRDLKISMQIRRIIIPTVRLAPESYGGPWFRATALHCISHSVLRYMVYRYGRVAVLRVSQRRNPNPNGRNPKSRRASLQRARGDI